MNDSFKPPLDNNSKDLDSGSCFLFRPFMDYIYKVVYIGSRIPYQFEYLYKLPDDLLFENNYARYRVFRDDLLLKKPDITLWGLMFAFGKPYWVKGLILYIIANICQTMVPLILLWFLKWYQRNDPSERAMGWIWASLFILANFLRALIYSNG